MVTRKLILGVMAVAGVGALSAPAMAVVVNNPVPDIFSDFTTVTYTVSSNIGTFTATGFAEHLRTDPTDGSNARNLNSGNFILHGTFNLSGNNISSISSSDVTISGTPSGGSNTTYFHSTHLASITPSGDTLTFHYTNGDNTYPGSFDVILHANSTYTFADFGHAFNNSTNGGAFSDTQSVPEPASLAVLGLGGLVMLRRRRAGAAR